MIDKIENDPNIRGLNHIFSPFFTNTNANSYKLEFMHSSSYDLNSRDER